jgi:tetratricopeptide (TPR) repeat protein
MTAQHIRSAAFAVAAIAIAAAPAVAQTAQALYERGAYGEAVQRVNTERAAGNEDPVNAYMAGQAYVKMNQPQEARTEFARLSNGGDETWKAIGQSAIALLDNALDEAVAEGQRARDAGGENGYAFYQLGLAHLRRNEFDPASQVLDRAAQLMPGFAYAHYQAGVAHQRGKRFNPMADHFQAFLKLAPNAPESGQVQLALRALKG